ncbi:MAG: hypothetical protein ABSA85_01375 [Terracidiphilus sp.]|jgi:hypothetical protein
MALIQVEEVERKGTRRAGRTPSGRGKKSDRTVAGASAGKPGIEPEREGTEGQSNAGAEPEKKSRGSGLKRLERAADRRLGQASEKLADLLLEKAREGKVESARLLVTLAEHREKRKPPEKKKKKRPGPSWAELLASEPEWKEPELGDVWVGDGWRKQSTGEFVGECERIDQGDEELEDRDQGIEKAGTQGIVGRG